MLTVYRSVIKFDIVTAIMKQTYATNEIEKLFGSNFFLIMSLITNNGRNKP